MPVICTTNDATDEAYAQSDWLTVWLIRVTVQTPSDSFTLSHSVAFDSFFCVFLCIAHIWIMCETPLWSPQRTTHWDHRGRGRQWDTFARGGLAFTHSHTRTLKLCRVSLITHCQPLIYPNFLTNFDHYDGCAIKIKIHAVSVSVLALFPLSLSLFVFLSLFALSLSLLGPGITRSLTATATAAERRVGHNKRCRCPLTMRSRKKMLSETNVQAQDLEMGGHRDTSCSKVNCMRGFAEIERDRHQSRSKKSKIGMKI